MITRTTFILLSFLLCAICIAADDPHAETQKFLQSYIGLYRADTLDKWKELFHPQATIMFPGDDGTVNVRTVDEFYQRQKNFFAQKKSISERLENVEIAEGRKISRVNADFIFVSDGVEKRGKLGLHLIESNQGWKIAALVFSYDNP